MTHDVRKVNGKDMLNRMAMGLGHSLPAHQHGSHSIASVALLNHPCCTDCNGSRLLLSQLWQERQLLTVSLCSIVEDITASVESRLV